MFCADFAIFLQCVPYGIACFGINSFYFVEDALHVCAVGDFLVGAEFYLFLISAQLGVFLDVALFLKTQRSDYCERHFLHLHYGWHCGE